MTFMIICRCIDLPSPYNINVFVTQLFICLFFSDTTLPLPPDQASLH